MKQIQADLRKKLHDIIWSDNAHDDDIDCAQGLEGRCCLMGDQADWIIETWDRVCGDTEDE